MKPWVTFKPVTPPGPGVTAWLGDGIVTPTPEGGGGWTVIPRPKGKGFTDWIGYGPYTLSIPILLDRFRWNDSVEPEIERLRRMMRVPDPTRGHPPIIRVTGPVPLSQLRYVITNITPGEETRRSSDGARTRAFMTVDLLEYVQADVLLTSRASPAAKAQNRAPVSSSTGAATSAGRTYTVKAGDTLYVISSRLLGNGNRWQEIANLNGIRDPRALKIGAVLRIP